MRQRDSDEERLQVLSHKRRTDFTKVRVLKVPKPKVLSKNVFTRYKIQSLVSSPSNALLEAYALLEALYEALSY